MCSPGQFILRHRAQLQHFLDDDTRIIEKYPAITRFVDTVLDDWDDFRAKHPGNITKHYSREEMTFWFCLYQLESVAEIPPDLPLLPYEAYQFDILRQTRELLRKTQPLPDLYYASRPNFSQDVDDDELDDMHDDWPSQQGKPALLH